MDVYVLSAVEYDKRIISHTNEPINPTADFSSFIAVLFSVLLLRYLHYPHGLAASSLL